MRIKEHFIKIIAYAIPALIVIVGLVIILGRVKHNDISINKVDVNNQSFSPNYRSYPIMGTWAEVTLYGNSENLNFAQDEIYKAFEKINDICNRFESDSELSKLNSSAADKPFNCSPLFWDILLNAKYFYKLSNGAFDVTITPLMKLWGFYRKQNKIPSEYEIKICLENVGLDKVVFDESKRTVFFKRKGLQIDLGGIAKGYAVDYAFKTIKKYKIEAGVINLGGNIRFFPKPPPEKEFYSVGVRNPFQKTKLMNGVLHLINQSLATSGDYERFIILNGQRYAHIINPKTGYPVKDMVSVTVISDSALCCDALSTSVFLNGKNFAEKINKKYPGIQFLIVKGYHDNSDSVEIYKIGKAWSEIALKSIY